MKAPHHCQDCGVPLMLPQAKRCPSCSKEHRAAYLAEYEQRRYAAAQAKRAGRAPKKVDTSMPVHADYSPQEIERRFTAALAYVRARRPEMTEEDCYRQRGNYGAEYMKRTPDTRGLPTCEEIRRSTC